MRKTLLSLVGMMVIYHIPKTAANESTDPEVSVNGIVSCPAIIVQDFGTKQNMVVFCANTNKPVALRFSVDHEDLCDKTQPHWNFQENAEPVEMHEVIKQSLIKASLTYCEFIGSMVPGVNDEDEDENHDNGEEQKANAELLAGQEPAIQPDAEGNKEPEGGINGGETVAPAAEEIGKTAHTPEADVADSDAKLNEMLPDAE